MGWPRNDGLRLYRCPKGKTNGGCYLLVDIDHATLETIGHYECVGEILVKNDPSNPHLATGGVSLDYLRSCRRVAWDDLPPVWRKAFRPWISGSPREHRGLHRV